MKVTQPKQDHPKFADWLKAYRATGKTAEVLATNAVWPLKAARAWTAHTTAG